MDAKLKRSMTSFTLTGDVQDVFDEKARVEVDKRCELIREEYARGDTPIIEPDCHWRLLSLEKN
jgi:hypothetical protein